MKKKLFEIYNFECPRWDDLPDDVFSSQIVDFVNERFGVVFIESPVLTQTMIQNYVKWKMLPKPDGRKYTREQVARIVVICIFKQVLSIKDIVEGVELQTRLLDVSESYNEFARKLEKSIKKVFGPVINAGSKEIVFDQYIMNPETMGMNSLIIAFSFKLLTEHIILNKGHKNLS